jgi:hypothetical protein
MHSLVRGAVVFVDLQHYAQCLVGPRNLVLTAPRVAQTVAFSDCVCLFVL